jgi:hypothetical protein
MGRVVTVTSLSAIVATFGTGEFMIDLVTAEDIEVYGH